MRLFEVDLGSARDVLAVFQGMANKEGQPSELPFPVVMKMIQPFALGISTPDGLIALKNEVDPAGDVIQDVLDDGTVILATNTPSDRQDVPSKAATAPAISKMASSNTDLTPNI